MQEDGEMEYVDAEAEADAEAQEEYEANMAAQAEEETKLQEQIAHDQAMAEDAHARSVQSLNFLKNEAAKVNPKEFADYLNEKLPKGFTAKVQEDGSIKID